MTFRLVMCSCLLTGLADSVPFYSSDSLPPGFADQLNPFQLDKVKNVGDIVAKSNAQVKCPKDDVDTPPFLIRPKRFVTNIHKWDKTTLKWRFRDPHKLFKKDQDYKVVRQTIKHALKMWGTASSKTLVFRDFSSLPSAGPVDIDIFFARWDHGDHEPFDGRGGIVAHSGYPQEGRVHFDASELWTISGSRGIDLRYVILHELGHALGLRHSHHASAIMHPIYQSPQKRLALSDDDVRGIRALYKPHKP